MNRLIPSLFRNGGPRRPPIRRSAHLQLSRLDERLLPSNTLVTNTTTFPAAAVVEIKAVWDMNRNGREDNGEAFVGSGNMVGRAEALTAGHVIYDNDPATAKSGYASWVEVTPGLNGSVRPFGSAMSTRLAVASGWTQRNENSDIGVIALNRNLGDRTGWFGYASLGDTLRAGSIINRLSYPASVTGGYNGTRMYYATGPVYQVTSATFSYRNSDLPSVSGTSGSGIYSNNVRIGNQFYNNIIVGVNVRSNDAVYGRTGYGFAIRFTPAWISFLNSTLSILRTAPASASTAFAVSSPSGSAVGGSAATAVSAPAMQFGATVSAASPMTLGMKAAESAVQRTAAGREAAYSRASADRQVERIEQGPIAVETLNTRRGPMQAVTEADARFGVYVG